MNTRRPQEGFTLIELMVALVIGVIAITTIYFVGAASARHFQEQQRIAQTQMSVRMAMEQLRRDIQRAGYLGTPNSRIEQRCRTPLREIQAVEFLNNDRREFLPNAEENGVEADTIRLVGNYASGGSYIATGLDSVGGRIFLQQGWQAFRRDFGIPGDTFDPERFRAVFRPGRMLHIRTLQGQHFFVEITGTEPGQAAVTFNPPIGVGGSCVGGLADGALVAPLSRIEYRVDDLTGGDSGSALEPVGGPVNANDSFRGQAGAQLVRREIDFDGNVVTTDEGSRFERIVLEYVAMVDYQFSVDTAAGPGVVANLEREFGQDAAARLDNVDTNPAADPQDVRSVTVSLSARTAEQDPRFPWVDSAAGDPDNGIAPTRYQVNSDYEGAARVRTLTTEIFLPNVANRMLR